MDVNDFFDDYLEKTQELELNLDAINCELDDDIELLEEIEKTKEIDLSGIVIEGDIYE